VTPNGLYFLGSLLGDSQLGRGAPLYTAVGGTQTITPITGLANDSPIFLMPFNASITNSALSIMYTQPPNVTVRGVALGSAYLRLVDPSTQLLFDRASITVKDVAAEYVRPADYMSSTADEQFAGDVHAAWALYTGASAEPILAELVADDGMRMADESLDFSLSAGGVTTTRTNWDVLAVTGPISGASASVHVSAGNATYVTDVAIPLASTVDDIAWVNAVGAEANIITAMHPSTPTTFCFRALSAGRLLAGVVWTFSGVTIVQRQLYAGKNCVTVSNPAAGTSPLMVNASGMVKTFTLTWGNTRPHPQTTPAESISPPEAAPGERAADQLE
jgi:hypothetical protein